MSILLPVPWFTRGDLRHRAQQIAAVFAKHGLGWLSIQFGLGDLSPASRLSSDRISGNKARLVQARHLRLAFEELGGTFIKLGQAVSTRPDIIPQEYAEELAKLQDSAPPEPLDDVLYVIREELHCSPDDLLAVFDPQPIASASIGQVHAGRLRNGDDVVIKIQRRGIAQQIEQDLLILSGMAEWAEAHSGLARDYRIASLVDEFSYTLRGELDYRAEGRNADMFRRNFAGEPALTIPRVYWQYTTDRVLTMERVGGIKISDVEALDRARIDRRLVAENSVRMMLREAFEFGFFHADPHAGNFFVRPDAGIVLIDFGMVGHLTPHVQDLLLETGLSLVRQDPERLTDDLYALGVATNPSRRAPLERDIARLLSRYATGSVKDLAATQMLNDLMGIAFRHRLHLPSEVIMLFRLIILSEGLGVSLDPNFQLFTFAAPYLQQMWRKRRSPEALATEMAQGMMDATEIGLQLPRQLARLLNQMERGTLQVSLSPEGMRDLIGQMQRMVNRLALSVILAGTIMGLGLIMVAYRPTGWEKLGGWLTIIAFIGSLLFGAAIMWSIFRTGGD